MDFKSRRSEAAVEGGFIPSVNILLVVTGERGKRSNCLVWYTDFLVDHKGVCGEVIRWPDKLAAPAIWFDVKVVVPMPANNHIVVATKVDYQEGRIKLAAAVNSKMEANVVL